MELVDRLTYRGPQVLAGLLFALVLLVVGAIMMTGSQQSSASDPLTAPQALTTEDSTLALVGAAVEPSSQPASPQAEQTAQVRQPATPSTTAEAANSSEPDPTGEPFPTSTSTGPGSSSSVATGSTSVTTAVPGSSTSTGGAATTTTAGNTTTSCPSGWTIDQDPTYCVDPSNTTAPPCNPAPGYPDPCNNGETNPCPVGYRPLLGGGCLMVTTTSSPLSTTTSSGA